MYNYQPLRTYLNDHGSSVKALMREVGFTTNVAVALNNDQPVTLDNLARICRHLKLPIEEVVSVDV